jgi:hypothetical protein
VVCVLRLTTGVSAAARPSEEQSTSALREAIRNDQLGVARLLVMQGALIGSDADWVQEVLERKQHDIEWVKVSSRISNAVPYAI